MGTPLVTCQNLIKIYKVPEANVEVVALQGLDLEVQRGEFIALVGRSGSGKTTLLNILGALDVPSAGQCAVNGYDLTQLSERMRNAYHRFTIGHVWQQAGRNLLPDLTIEDNVLLPQLLAGEGKKARQSRTQHLLEQIGLADIRQTLPGYLSGGEQQRAAIAVALANEPALLLADEPTGELDSTTAQQVLTLLGELHRNLGLTILLVSHDSAAASAAERTIAIRDGRTSAEIVRRAHSDPNSTVRVDEPDEEHVSQARSIGVMPDSSLGVGQVELVIMDQASRLQLPEGVTGRIAFDGRADLRIRTDHVELWPADVADPRGDDARAEDSMIELPGSGFHERVVIDRAGRLQLSEAARERISFNRYVVVRLVNNHVELWPDQGDGTW
jgi:ABC-type lipoprotein export system ATPase subunit/DNA-binding transcriptional regulator/RsmH inhibitor MraZ